MLHGTPSISGIACHPYSTVYSRTDLVPTGGLALSAVERLGSSDWRVGLQYTLYSIALYYRTRLRLLLVEMLHLQDTATFTL